MTDPSTAATAPRSFLIADDHPMVRDALSTALSHAFPGAAVALAGSLAGRGAGAREAGGPRA